MKKSDLMIFDKEDVYRMLSMPVCIELMKKVLSDLAKGLASQILRTGMGVPKGALAYMPCYLGGNGSFGAKIISVYPGNAKDGFPSHQGYVMLFEETHGEAVAMADACAITEIRTAAASAAASDLLARKDSSHLAILGSGAQAVSHLEAMSCIRELKEVTVWSYHKEHAEAFADRMGGKYDFSIRVCDTVHEATKDADLICSVCRSREPILGLSDVRPGTHINAVGTCSPVSREVDSDLVAASRLYADQIEACEAESGEYLIPLEEGRITRSHLLGSIGDVINGVVPGREKVTEITIFDSLGLAAEDVICADYLWREGLKRKGEC